MATTNENIYVNGKAKVIEMLQHMEPEHRNKLLKNMKIMNPTVTLELMEKSIAFNDIELLSSDEISLITRFVDASVFGIAMKTSSLTLQRKVLSAINREYAQSVYDSMIKPIGNEFSNSKKAQERVLEIIQKLTKNKQISL